MTVRVLLADDHQIMRQGLRSLINKEPGMEVIAQASNGQEAIKLAFELRPNVILMDVNMPGLNGIDASSQILARLPETKILALSMHSTRKFVLGMLKAGVSGYMLKDCAFEELIHAVRTLMAGQVYLSPKIAGTLIEDYRSLASVRESLSTHLLTVREREVLQSIAEGKSTKEIADSLNLSVKTIETHRRNIMEKLNIRSTAELTVYAIREGIISIDT
ncbi:MAG: response regulator transcription factor [Desulfatiglandales bacterium]